MSYEKQNFKDGEKLKASQLNHMEDGIAKASDIIVAKFEMDGEMDRIWCNTHTALELYEALMSGVAVLAWIDCRADFSKAGMGSCTAESFSNSPRCLYVLGNGELSTYNHVFGDETSYKDGNPSNATIGNELFYEY